MKLSLNWINQYVKVQDLPVEDLVKKLTLATCEVEDVIHAFQDLDKVIVARVDSLEKHPDADKLNICQVFDGESTLQVICGAPNVRPGIHVMFAPVGVTIGDPAQPLKIEKRKIRGVESSGMICAPAEVGADLLFPDRDGILILDDEELRVDGNEPGPEKFLGKPVSALLPLTDTVLDIDNKSITHRPDLWCHFGFAREIAAIYRRSIHFDPLETESPATAKGIPAYNIEIRNQAALGYSGLSANGIQVRPSPLWLRARLAAVGQKSISNIVDASNYVMLELAQPNHAFDRNKLGCDTIAIDLSSKGIQVDTLDDETTDVPEQSVLILAEGGQRKKSHPVAVGGIIGGSETAISEDTTEIFLESATFPRERIRRTLSRLPLRTDSAVRFEKGQDPAKMVPGLNRLAAIIQKLCPEASFGKLVKSGDSKGTNNKIKTDLNFLRSRLGFDISADEVIDTMQRLSFRVSVDGKEAPATGGPKEKNARKSDAKSGAGKAKKGAGSKSGGNAGKKKASGKAAMSQSIASGENPEFLFVAPTFRSQYDVSIPEDIIEELGRIYGYDNIPETGPSPAVQSIPRNDRRNLERLLKQAFRSHGFYETMNYSFCSEAENEPFGGPGLKILNPVNASQGRMRLSQIPGIIKQGALNQNRFDSVRLLELGRVFDPGKTSNKDPEKNLPLEKNRISILSISDEDRRSAFEEFLDVRNTLETFLAGLNISFYMQIPTAKQFYLHPGCQIEIGFVATDGDKELEDVTLLGYGGLVHPGYASGFELKRSAVLFDLDFDVLARWTAARSRQSFYSPPGNQPDSLFEFTVVLKENDSTSRPVDIVRFLDIEEVKDIALKTIYRGAPLEADEMAVSYKVRASRHNETLSGKDSQKILDQIIQALKNENIPLRS